MAALHRPALASASHMSPGAQVYHDLIVRSVTGRRPAMATVVADSPELQALCEQLARAERIAELLQAKGLDRLPIDEGVALLLECA